MARTGRPSREKSAATSSEITTLRAEVRALKRLVSLQKTKQKILCGKQISQAQIDTLLLDYLNLSLSLTASSAGSVLLKDGNELVFRACRGRGASGLIGRRMPVTEGIAGWVIKTGRTYHCPDVTKDTRWSSRIGAEIRFKTRNIIAAPLRTDKDTIGVIELINKMDGQAFGRNDIAILDFLADQLALDVAYTNLLAESRREIGRRALQMELANVLNSTLDQREVRRRAMEAATSLMDAEVGSLLLVDEKSNDLFFEVALGERGEKLKQIRLRMGEGIAGWVAQHNEPALVNDVESDPRHFKKAGVITGFRTRNMVCVPVRSRGKVIGVLQAINKKDGGLFTEQDLNNFLTLSNQVAIALENAHLYEELKETFMSTAEALAAAVEKKDPYTGGHIRRVVAYSMAIARHMGLSPADMEKLRLGAVLHDIGKIGIRDSVLLKQGGLSTEELTIMRSHPLLGADILGHIEQMRGISRIMRSHHEKWDGSGYPDGLKGEAIPIQARIISVADAFDAITTDRPYRKAADIEAAKEEIRRFSGRDFDPNVVDAFLRAIEDGDIILDEGHGR